MAGGKIMKCTIMLNSNMNVEIREKEARIIDGEGNVVFSTLEYRGLPDVPDFFVIGNDEREKVQKWVDEIGEDLTFLQKSFVERVKTALDNIHYDYLISTLEPSLDAKGNIYFKEGEPVATDLTACDWKKKAKNFYEKNGWHSELANLYEGDLFIAYRVAMDYWTMEYVCNDSSMDGNYEDSPIGTNELDVSGAKEVGGFKDGIGNTYKIYQGGDCSYAISGGYYCSVGRIYRNLSKKF